MKRFPTFVLSVRQRYGLGCILFISLFLLFNYFLVVKTKVVRVDIDLEVEQPGTLRIYSPKNNDYTETYTISQPISPEQREYSVRIPCRTEDARDVLLVISPIDSPHSIRLNDIQISHIFFEPISLDLSAHFKNPEDFSNIEDIQYLSSGAVKLSPTTDNPIFHVREELQVSRGLLFLVLISLCGTMWLLFNPTMLKGNRRGGYLLFEVADCDWQVIESAMSELEKCCHGFALSKAITAADRHSFLFTFKQVDETGLSAVRLSLAKKGATFSLRVQMNRSGEL